MDDVSTGHDEHAHIEVFPTLDGQPCWFVNLNEGISADEDSTYRWRDNEGPWPFEVPAGTLFVLSDGEWGFAAVHEGDELVIMRSWDDDWNEVWNDDVSYDQYRCRVPFPKGAQVRTAPPS